MAQSPNDPVDISPDQLDPLMWSDLKNPSTVRVGNSESPIATEWKSRNYIPDTQGWMLSSNGTHDGFGGGDGGTRYIFYRLVPSIQHITTGTAVAGKIEIPFACTITDVGAYVDTAGGVSTTTIDINNNGVSIFTTRITIDAGETSSRTAATSYQLSTTSLAEGDLLSFDVDGISNSPFPLGLTVRVEIE